MIRRTFFACAALLVISAQLASSAEGVEIVQTESGPIQGVASTSDAVTVFKGIPFAAPPVGELRWKPPQPPTSWTETRVCDEFGAKSLQKSRQGAGVQSEDCLYLNVWAPEEKSESKLPVMVWIHGGGFTQGSGHEGGYDGARLASRGVVLVTINYRLGALGFMTHPELSAESPHNSSGNYAILDQIAALRWVHENIGNFGGDSENVTIFGESAGGTSVYLLTATPLSQGLFHRAILQSPWLDPVIFRDLKAENENGPSAEYDGLEQSRRLLKQSSDDSLDQLRELPAEDVLERMKQRWPVAIDGWVFPRHPHQIYEDGDQHDIPVIVGTNRDEGTMFAPRDPFDSIDDYRAAMTERFGDQGDKVAAYYVPDSDSDIDFRKVLVQQITDGWFVQPARQFARAMNRQATPVWMYHFTKPVWGWMGAAHAAEIGFVFGNLEEPSDDDQRLSDAMMDYWVQFATTGNPEVADLAAWPGYTTKDDQHLVLDASIKVGQGLRCDACDLLDSIVIARNAKDETSETEAAEAASK